MLGNMSYPIKTGSSTGLETPNALTFVLFVMAVIIWKPEPQPSVAG